MRYISIERDNVDGKTIITVEERILFFFKKIKKFKAIKHEYGEYWKWAELPSYKDAGYKQFQLNTWKENFE